jgi:hypothetical protein
MKSCLTGKGRQPLSAPYKASIFFSALCVFAVTLSHPFVARAQNLTTVTPLYFGEIVIRDFNTLARVTIQPSGTYTTNANVYLHLPPTRGEYFLDGYAPNTLYTVTLPSSITLMGPGGAVTVDNFAVRPNVLITNAAGDDTFFISGRMRTLGGGTVYNDGIYDTVFLVTLNF